jgi:hypothetical protein
LINERTNYKLIEEAAQFCIQIGLQDKALKYYLKAIDIYSENDNERKIVETLEKMESIKN